MQERVFHWRQGVLADLDYGYPRHLSKPGPSVLDFPARLSWFFPETMQRHSNSFDSQFEQPNHWGQKPTFKDSPITHSWLFLLCLHRSTVWHLNIKTSNPKIIIYGFYLTNLLQNQLCYCLWPAIWMIPLRMDRGSYKKVRHCGQSALEYSLE